jgi:hypothetical protein
MHGSNNVKQLSTHSTPVYLPTTTTTIIIIIIIIIFITSANNITIEDKLLQQQFSITICNLLIESPS